MSPSRTAACCGLPHIVSNIRRRQTQKRDQREREKEENTRGKLSYLTTVYIRREKRFPHKLDFASFLLLPSREEEEKCKPASYVVVVGISLKLGRRPAGLFEPLPLLSSPLSMPIRSPTLPYFSPRCRRRRELRCRVLTD